MEPVEFETPNPNPDPNVLSPEEERVLRWRIKVSQNTARGTVRVVAAAGACEPKAKGMAPGHPITREQADKRMRHHLSLAIMYGAAKGVRP